MADRRKPKSQVSPFEEDRGIFKSMAGQLVVELVPLFARTSRDDIMVKGYIDGTIAIDVVFAGRRAKMAQPVVDRLRSLWTSANASAAAQGKIAEADDVRIRMRIEGAWRPRFEVDDQGWQTRQHQLYAARWTVASKTGEPTVYGEPVAARSAAAMREQIRSE